MTWEEYKIRFAEEATHQGKSPPFVAECLTYAERLFRAGLPVLYDLSHLASEVGVSEQSLLEMMERPDAFYFQYRIPKRTSGFRSICESLWPLRGVQCWILRKILDRRIPHDAAKAFVRGRSIKLNAKDHVGQRRVLSMDVRNFFGSVRRKRVVSVFLEMGYSSTIAHALTDLTMFREQLPQGAPTSPALSNLVMVRVDETLALFASKRSLRYTRYADDITFSGSFRAIPIIDKVRSALGKVELQLNVRKTRLMCRHQRQEVTGVVVNSKIQAPRELRRQLRQEIYYLRKFGKSGHRPRSSPLHGNRLDHLRGVAEFIRFLNPGDRDAQAAIELLGRYHFSDDEAEK